VCSSDLQNPAYCRHKGSPFEVRQLWFTPKQFTARFMVLWRMALVADRSQVIHAVGTTLASVLNVMNMQDYLIFNTFSTALAGIIVSSKDRFPKCCNVITFPMLVIGPSGGFSPFSIAFNNCVSNCPISME